MFRDAASSQCKCFDLKFLHFKRKQLPNQNCHSLKCSHYENSIRFVIEMLLFLLWNVQELRAHIFTVCGIKFVFVLRSSFSFCVFDIKINDFDVFNMNCRYTMCTTNHSRNRQDLTIDRTTAQFSPAIWVFAYGLCVDIIHMEVTESTFKSMILICVIGGGWLFRFARRLLAFGYSCWIISALRALERLLFSGYQRMLYFDVIWIFFFAVNTTVGAHLLWKRQKGKHKKHSTNSVYRIR